MTGTSSVAELAVQLGIGETKKGVIESTGRESRARGRRLSEDGEQHARPDVVRGLRLVVFRTAATKLGVRNPFPKIFLSPALQVGAAREGKIVKVPARGDVFVREQKPTGFGHR